MANSPLLQFMLLRTLGGWSGKVLLGNHSVINYYTAREGEALGYE